MNTDVLLIEKTIELFELNTGWGDSAEWTNKDFLVLSAKIQKRTGVALSHVTLKRVWGKVQYHSLPSTHTLDTLVQFLEYENWRKFKLQNADRNSNAQAPGLNINKYLIDDKTEAKKNKRIFTAVLFVAIPFTLIPTIMLFYKNKLKAIQ